MKILPLSKKQIISAAAIIIIVAVFIAWWFLSRVEVEAYKVEQQDAIKGVTVTGTVQSRQDIQVAASVTAKIKQTNYREGAYISAGTTLAFLERDEVRGDITSAQGRLEAAQAQLRDLQTEPLIEDVRIAEAQVEEIQENIDVLQQELQRNQILLQEALNRERRFLRLYQQGAVSRQEYEDVYFARLRLEREVSRIKNQIQATRAQLEQAQQNLILVEGGVKVEKIQAAQGEVQVARGNIESTQGRLDDYIIKSPISGYITEEILEVGEVATPNSPILRMVSPDSIYLSAQVEENEINNVQVGQTAYLIFDAYPNQSYIGEVIRIIRDVDPITGTFETEISLPTLPKKPVIVGMTADSTIVTQNFNDIIIIPREFVFTENKKSFVYKKVGNKARKTFIDYVEFDNNRVRITKNLRKGEVIVKGFDTKTVSDGNRIKIEEFYKD